jgi:ABC-type glycerol-3-phosphate transport system permease component
MAATTANIVIPIAIFYAFQRYFVQGIAMTGLKE